MAEKKETSPKKAPDFDVFDPANSLFCPMPTSSTRLFLQKAEKFNIKGRSGGPCVALQKLHMPNGDRAIPGDTFDPVEERMPAREYISLMSRKFFETAHSVSDGDRQKMETKLMKIEAKK